jgi:nitroreductase
MKILLAALFVVSASCGVFAQEKGLIQLPVPRKTGGMPLMEALASRHSSRDFAPDAVPQQELSNILWAAFGINRADKDGRTAPSAKNWRETDIYVVLPDGAYVYDAKANALNPVAPGDLRAATGVQPFVAKAPVGLVYVADYAKTGKGAREEKDFLSAADAGFIAENAYLYSASAGLSCVVRASFDKAALSSALKLRKDQHIILAQTLGYPSKPAAAPQSPVATPVAAKQ